MVETWRECDVDLNQSDGVERTHSCGRLTKVKRYRACDNPSHLRAGRRRENGRITWGDASWTV